MCALPFAMQNGEGTVFLDTLHNESVGFSFQGDGSQNAPKALSLSASQRKSIAGSREVGSNIIH